MGNYVNFKDISNLSQKSAIAGTEKIPISDTEYITPSQIAASASAPGTLDTTATTAQSTNASESLSGSVTLHKIAKTGTYSDLIGAPTTVLTYTVQDVSAPTVAELTGVFTAAAAEITAGRIPILVLTQGAGDITAIYYLGFHEIDGDEIYFVSTSDGVYYNQIILYGANNVDFYHIELEVQSHKVTSLSSQSRDVQYPSAKAVYDEVHPAVGSSQPAGGMLPNVFYDLGTLSGNTTFAFATASDNTIENEWMFEFTTPSTAPTITWPNAITGWAGGTAPTISASKTYQVSVLNGLGVIAEF